MHDIVYIASFILTKVRMCIPALVGGLVGSLLPSYSVIVEQLKPPEIL